MRWKQCRDQKLQKARRHGGIPRAVSQNASHEPSLYTLPVNQGATLSMIAYVALMTKSLRHFFKNFFAALSTGTNSKWLVPFSLRSVFVDSYILLLNWFFFLGASVKFATKRGTELVWNKSAAHAYGYITKRPTWFRGCVLGPCMVLKTESRNAMDTIKNEGCVRGKYSSS